LAKEVLTNPLTRREEEILLLVAQGHSNKTIAETLNLSEKTVRNHVTHLLKKLEKKRRTELVRYAWKTGLISKSQEPLQGDL
jgi:DNA-binding NarL/FixJ family response regulator